MISLKCDCIEELIKASQGYIENDTVFENIKIGLTDTLVTC